MPNKLIELLAIEASELDIAFQKASVEGRGTPHEIGDRREAIVQNFLRKYFPYPFRFVKGNIIDSHGNESASIDCIILNPSHPYTIDAVNEKASVILADGVDYAIEIKSKLSSKDELERALKQIQSVKSLSKVRAGSLAKNVTEHSYKIPCIIYAHEAYKDVRNLLIDIVDYYCTNNVKRINQFDIIATKDLLVVNSKGQPVQIGLKNGLYICETQESSLTLLLYLMSCYPLSEMRISRDILSIYLKDIKWGNSHFDKLNERLESIENNSLLPGDFK